MLSRTKRGLLLTVLGTTCLFMSVGYATWVNTYIKVENNDVPPIKKYTVKFYDQNSHLLGNYTISGLEIDSIIELPYLEDNEKYDFVGWKENGGSAVFKGSMGVNSLTFDSNDTAALYADYESTNYNVKFSVTTSLSPKTYTEIVKTKNSTKFYLFNLNPTSFFGVNVSTYKLVSYTYNRSTTYSINSMITLDSNYFPEELGPGGSHIISLVANYETI
ncbi:MAG: hypothetical protein PUI56_01690 [bacterium]|nr:hypothetical protein [bacterium]MDY5257361.1 hypothetical protein [Candidatus Enterosoma sp.]